MSDEKNLQGVSNGWGGDWLEWLTITNSIVKLDFASSWETLVKIGWKLDSVQFYIEKFYESAYVKKYRNSSWFPTHRQKVRLY